MGGCLSQCDDFVICSVPSINRIFVLGFVGLIQGISHIQKITRVVQSVGADFLKQSCRGELGFQVTKSTQHPRFHRVAVKVQRAPNGDPSCRPAVLLS